MSTNVTLNGVTYAIPAEGDSGWGTVLSNYFIAIASGVLQKSGGTFTLTAETDFGATYGLKTAYLKSQAANPSGVGIVRLGNTEAVGWRNAANNGNLSLTVNGSDALQFNGTSLPLSGSIVNADISASAAIAYSKLNLADSILNADINSAAAIAYSKLNLSGSILNADVNASAAIALSKLEPVSGLRALVSDTDGFVSASSISSTELSYLANVTSAIQTQLDSKVAKSTLTTKGDIYVATGSGVVVRKAAGADGTVLTAASGESDGLSWSSPLTNPMTTGGDLIYGGASGTATRLANGSAGQILVSAGGTSAPAWTTVTTSWASWTPTGSWNTNVTYTGKWRRVGDTLEAQVLVMCSGAPNSTTLTVNLTPLSLTIDTAKLLSTTNFFINLGRGTALNAGVELFPVLVQYTSTTAVAIFAPNSAGAYNSLVGVDQSVPLVFGASDGVQINFSVPISGW